MRVNKIETYIDFVQSGVALVTVHGRWDIWSGATWWWIRYILSFRLLSATALVRALTVVLRLAQRIVASWSVATVVRWLRELCSRRCIRGGQLLWIQCWRSILKTAWHHVAAIEVCIRKIEHRSTGASLLWHCARHITDWARIVVGACKATIGHRVGNRAKISITYTRSTQACWRLIINIIISRLRNLQHFSINIFRLRIFRAKRNSEMKSVKAVWIDRKALIVNVLTKNRCEELEMSASENLVHNVRLLWMDMYRCFTNNNF